MLFPFSIDPYRQSLPPLLGPSTVSWLAVMACTVVMSPSTIPKLSFRTLATGARQLVVHDALETTSVPAAGGGRGGGKVNAHHQEKDNRREGW